MVEKHLHRIMVKNPRPYTGAREHLVLWERTKKNSELKDIELSILMRSHKDYIKIENTEEDKSRKSQRHIHFVKR
jgi:hypothetical protein